MVLHGPLCYWFHVPSPHQAFVYDVCRVDADVLKVEVVTESAPGGGVDTGEAAVHSGSTPAGAGVGARAGTAAATAATASSARTTRRAGGGNNGAIRVIRRGNSGDGKVPPTPVPDTPTPTPDTSSPTPAPTVTAPLTPFPSLPVSAAPVVVDDRDPLWPVVKHMHVADALRRLAEWVTDVEALDAKVNAARSMATAEAMAVLRPQVRRDVGRWGGLRGGVVWRLSDMR